MNDEPQQPDISSLPLYELAAYQERLAQQYTEVPCKMILGFKEEPHHSFYAVLEAYGGVLLEAESHATGGVVERMPWWQYWPWRLLWKLGIKLDWPHHWWRRAKPDE